MKTGRKLVSVSVALILVLSIVYVQFMVKPSEPKLQVSYVPFLTPLEIRNPEIALKYGIVGYVEITLASGSPESLSISRGTEASITILLRFVSHISEVAETQVRIDPKSGEGLVIEQSYAIEDTKGNIIGRGAVYINEVVSYNPSGVVTLKTGQTLPVTLTACVPPDFPSGVSSFPLGAVGITANVPIIDDVEVMVNA